MPHKGKMQYSFDRKKSCDDKGLKERVQIVLEVAFYFSMTLSTLQSLEVVLRGGPRFVF